MSTVYLGRGTKRQALTLGVLLGEGASGKVYAIDDAIGHAAKLYHGADEARRYEAKIDAMLAHPPHLPPGEYDGFHFPQIAWPEAKLFDIAGNFIGFMMPEIDFTRSTGLVNLLQKNSRRVEKLSEYYGYRVLVARNLASVIAELHRAGHHMIDMKPANLRFYPAMSWMAVVDADGFSIAGAAGRIAAEQLSDEYIAPESWQKKPSQLGLEQDLFALAVIIFQLLNNGVHPFAGSAGAGADGQATDLQTRILNGLYPYAIAPKPDLVGSAASVHRMFRRTTREMFDQAFLTEERPSAERWRDHLDALVAQLVPCEVKPGEHAHFGSGCGFCGHDARVAAVAARPRPTPQVRLPTPNQHLAARRYRSAHMAALPPPRLTGMRAVAMLGMALVPLLGAFAVVLSDDTMRRSIFGDVRAAEYVPGEPPAELDNTPMGEPSEYVVIPGEPLNLREGPGESFESAGALEPQDNLVGRPASAEDGAMWIWVTRLSDGASGYVPRTRLTEREVAPTEAVASCPAGKPCVDDQVLAGERVLVDRYKLLLSNADGINRRYFLQSQRLWEAQRRHCYSEPNPAACRRRINAQQLSDLDVLANNRMEAEKGEGIAP